MANNYIPNGELAILVGDGSISKPTPQPTKVGGDKVNSCIETQSTTRSDIFLKPKTDAQIAAIPNPTLGMVAVSSDSGKMVVREAAGWSPLNPITGTLYQSLNLTTAQVQGMNAAPVQILPAPGVGIIYLVHGFRFSKTYAGALFVGGGDIAVQYGTTAGGSAASNALANTLLTTTTSSEFAYATGNDSTVVSAVNSVNLPLSITNASAAFTGGGTTTCKVDVWYSIIPL